MSMEERIKKLEEKWAEEDAGQEKTEDQKINDSLFGMEQLIYSSRSLRFDGNSNVTVTEIDDEKKK